MLLINFLRISQMVTVALTDCGNMLTCLERYSWIYQPIPMSINDQNLNPFVKLHSVTANLDIRVIPISL